jgi:hypothetical protein
MERLSTLIQKGSLSIIRYFLLMYSDQAGIVLLMVSRQLFNNPSFVLAHYSHDMLSVGVFYGSLVSVILLFAVPMILLGYVSPFAIRLRIERLGKSGRTAGQLYPLDGPVLREQIRYV